MNLPPSIKQRRTRTLIALGAASALCLVIMALDTMSFGDTLERHARSGDPLFSDSETLEALSRIDVKLADESYSLIRSGEGWRMSSADGFPVRTDRMGAFLTGLRELSWGDARTSDVRKLERIGLSDPDNGGNGTIVRLYDDDGGRLGGFVAGRRDGQLYMRRAGENLSFSVDGELPGLRTRQGWLDFEVITMLPDAIAGIVLESTSGERLHLTRGPSGGPRDFVPGPGYPNDRLVNRLAAASPALALSRFAPLDVKPDRDLQSDAVARHTTLTQDGLEIIVDAYEESDGFYLTVTAVEAAEGARRAQAINSRARGWAFRVSRYDWADYTTPISDIVERALIPAPEE